MKSLRSVGGEDKAKGKKKLKRTTGFGGKYFGFVFPLTF